MQFNPLTVILDKDLWRLGLFWGMITCLVFFVLHWSKKIGWVASIVWGYVLASCLITLEYPAIRFGAFNTAFIATSGQSFAEALLIPMAVLSIPEKWMDYVFRTITALICVEIIIVWINGYGIMIAPSFDTALLALYIPFASAWLYLPIIATIIAHHGSTAMLILAGHCIILALTNKKIRPYAIAMIPITIAAMFFHSHGGHLDMDERMTVWQSMLNHWWNGTQLTQVNPNGQTITIMQFGGNWIARFLGASPGSFLWLSIMLEPAHMFLSAHSEIVQILFELGIVGLCLAFALVLSAIKSAWNRPGVVSAVLGVCACSLTYHPLRFAPTAILAAFIFREALLNKNGQ